MLAVTLFAGTVSAFVSNTGTVAILIPIVMGVAAAKKVPPCQLLMPLTAGATLGRRRRSPRSTCRPSSSSRS